MLMYNTLMNEEDKPQSVAGWTFKPGAAPVQTQATATDAPDAAQAPPPPNPSAGGGEPPAEAHVTWTASEYIANPKNAGWFMLLGLASIVLAAIVYLITRDVVSTVVIIVLGIIVGIFAARQPHVLQYSLDTAGVHMGHRNYPYSGFKSFSVVSEGAFSHISLLPLKRFMPPLVVHYSPEDEEKIINTLADYLPYEEYKRDLVESFSRKIRF